MSDFVSGVRADLYSLFAQWMSIRYPRFDNPHSVIGKYTPDGIVDNLFYYSWAIIGAIITALLYPVVLMGFSLRVGATGIKRAVYGLGVVGTSIFLFGLWGSLVGFMVYLYGFESSVAVIFAVCVAVVSVLISVGTHRYMGSLGMTLIGYPSVYTSIFLPPITAAVVAPNIGGDILRQSVLFAEYILETFATPLNIESILRTTFELSGFSHIILWVSVSLVLGWSTGVFIKISTLARPRDD